MAERTGARVEINRARGLYMGYYMAYGAFVPFINLYYQRLGMSGIQIGVLSAVPVLVAAIGSLMWAMVADAFHIRDRLLSLALLLMPIPILLFSGASTYLNLIFLSILYAICVSPIGSLLDGLAVEKVKAYQVSFGSLRVWGSIGWTLSAWLVGLLVEGGEIREFFYAAAGLFFLTFVLSLFGKSPGSRVPGLPGRNLRGFLTLEIGLFLASTLLLSISIGAGGAFTSIYLNDIGAKEGTIGLGWALASLGEIPMMFLSGYLLRRLGTKKLIQIAILLYAIRWLLFSFINNPTWALLVQVLGGVSFAIFLVAGVSYISSLAPEGMSVTAQAIFSATYFSAGSIIGGLLGGYFYDAMGISSLFRLLGMLALGGFLLFYFGNARRPRLLLERD